MDKENPPTGIWRKTLSGLLLAGLVTLAFNYRWDTKMGQWCQPSDIEYGSYDPYCLTVLRTSINWLQFPPCFRYEIYVGWGTAAPSYGHSVDHSFILSDVPANEELKSYINRSTVDWGPQGVTFSEPDGHSVFIPKQALIGGR